LLGIARSSIAAALIHKPAPQHRPSEELLAQGGAFVTIRINGELRGCIGFLEATMPLALVVGEAGVKAALEDPRFPPMSQEELAEAVLEISVLNPMRIVHDISDVRVGEHGVMLEHGPYRGVLLPQVATEFGWNNEEFLDAVSRKAGLNVGAWREPGARISVFSAEVFDERGFHGGRKP
jgi:AmmeMemoRadiSam system protein A